MTAEDESKRRRNKREERSDQMPTAASAEVQEAVVQFGGRIPTSLRRRVKICAAAQELDAQDVLREALEEYLAKRNF